MSITQTELDVAPGAFRSTIPHQINFVFRLFKYLNTNKRSIIHECIHFHHQTGLPMSTSSLSNNSLNSSSGTFNSNSSLNSTPSADRYAALKDLDEQLREAKAMTETVTEQTNPPGKKRKSC